MDWWHTASLMATLVLTGTAVATFAWRVLRRETDKLRLETESLRLESREAHEGIRGEIAQLRRDQDLALARVEDGLRAELRESQQSLRAEFGEAHKSLRAEMQEGHKGLRESVMSLQEGHRSLLEGQASLREELGEVRGELRGVTRSLLALREDFRAHVLAGAD